jgi:hypothetical protein
VEPPKYITGKHVAAIFEKLGFDATCGQKVGVLLFGVVTHASWGMERAVRRGDCKRIRIASSYFHAALLLLMVM